MLYIQQLYYKIYSKNSKVPWKIGKIDCDQVHLCSKDCLYNHLNLSWPEELSSEFSAAKYVCSQRRESKFQQILYHSLKVTLMPAKCKNQFPKSRANY